MTQDDKINIDLDIMNLVKKLIENSENTKNAVLYIRADAEFKTASVDVRGDFTILSGAIQSQLDNNPGFKQFILSVIGSWLSKNPTDEKMFLNGLEIAKKTFSIN